MLLQQVARRLEGCVRAEDTVARLGGDEFGIVLATIERADDCGIVAGKVLAALAQPFTLDGAVARISASVGGALLPAMGTMPRPCWPRPTPPCTPPSRRARTASAWRQRCPARTERYFSQ